MDNSLLTLLDKGTSLKGKKADVVLLLLSIPTNLPACQAQALQSSKSHPALPSAFLAHLVFATWNMFSLLYGF